MNTANPRLDTLRHALLDLHKTLLDAQRVRYEREHGRVESSGDLLDLALNHPYFEWLRVLSALIAGLDELEEEGAQDSAEMRSVIERLRSLVRFEGNPGFTGPYREIIDAVPDALVAHVRLSRLLAAFDAAPAGERVVSKPAELVAALAFAADKHRNQRRKDAEGSPYINHPIELAKILAIEGGVEDMQVLCAAVLHDTIEDTQTSYEELAARFGSEVADVVREVTDDKSLPKGERKRLQIEHAPRLSQAAKQIGRAHV